MGFFMKFIPIKSFGFPKNPLFLFWLFAFTILCNVSIVYSQNAEYYYQLGLQLKDENNIDEAIDAFNKAILKNHKFAKAYHQLALCYLRQTDSNVSLKLATDAITEALFLDRDNTEYTITLADIYCAKNDFSGAKRLIEDILEKNPDDVPALKRLAEYNLKEYKSYQYQTSRVNRLFNYAGSLKAEIRRLHNAILRLDPNDRETIFNKAMLYFDDSDLDTFIELLEKIVDANENDKEANLFLGLGYSKKNEHEKAFFYYDKAFSLMSPGERFVFENPVFIDAKIDVDMRGDFKLLSVADTSHFWDKMDPIYLTDINERKLVHYGRVAEANLRFSVPKKGIPGWQTAMGLVWIKYGKPLRIGHLYIRNSSEFIQTWVYKDFSFKFYAGYNAAKDNNYKFELETGYSYRYGLPNVGVNIENKIASHPEIYEYKPRGELLKFPINILNFRGNNDKTEVEIFYGLATNKITWEPVMNEFHGAIQYGIFVHDNNWNRIVEKVDTSFHEFDKSEIDTASISLLVSSDKFEIDPGNYNLSFEVLEPNSGNAGVTRDSLFVERFGRDSLQMSDILAAYNIELTDEHKPPSRDNITIDGDPQHAFTRDQWIYIYYEVYNLFIINEQGENYYKVEYSFRPIDIETSRQIHSKRLIKNTPFKPREQEGVWVSSEIHGFGKTDFNILQIEHGLPEIGVYELVVKITDMYSGMTVVKSTPIQIYN